MPDGSFAPRNLSGKQRVFAPLEQKAVEETTTHYIIRGVASTPRVDRMGDIVEPLGAKYDRMPKLMLYHDSTRPVGNLSKVTRSSSGIPFEAAIPKVAEPGAVRDRIEEAVHSVKYDLLSYVSIGFNPIDYEPLDPKDPWGGQRFKSWDFLELSLVTIPANPDAVITGVKSIDDELRAARLRHRTTAARAAPGRTAPAVDPPPGASGPSKPPSGGFFSPQGKGTMKTMEMQAHELRATRETNAKRMEELLHLKDAEGRSFTDGERAEFDGLKSSIVDLDDAISVKEMQRSEARTAKPIDSPRAATYGFVKRQDPDDKFKGQSETRRIIARALSHNSMKSGDFKSAAQIAEERYGRTHPNLVQVMRSGVAGAGSGSGETWAELVQADGRFTGDFIEFLYSMTVFDKLPLREIPANVIVKGQDGAATAYFVGESKGIPVSAGSGSAVTLTPFKCAAISVSSNELLADSSPAAEMLIRDSLVEASAQKIDTLFFSTTAASSGVAPAGILNGLAAGDSAGNTPAHIIADIQALLANFITGKYSSDLYLVMTPTLSAALGMMVNSLGLPAFPNSSLTQKGGTFQGYPTLTGHNIPSGDVIMMSPRDVWRIGDSGVQVSVSQEATIEQDTAPQGATDTPVAASATLTNMFQEESTAFKVVRRINWQKRRSDAVAYISPASYASGS